MNILDLELNWWK